MVANLSSHKRGWDERWEEFSNYADKGQQLMKEMMQLVDADTNAFNLVMEAFGLPKSNDEEKAARSAAIKAATIGAIKVPFRTMELALEIADLAKVMAEIGNPNSVSDAGVGGLCARAALKGGYFNVKINAQGYGDDPEVKAMVQKAEEMNRLADEKEKQIWDVVMATIKS